MPNRQLTAVELLKARALLDKVRSLLARASGRDEALMWALRRKVYKELMYDERGKPMHRVVLKLTKRTLQGGKCALCRGKLPERGTVLDRLQAMKGYTIKNTRLLCAPCDTRVQQERRYA